MASGLAAYLEELKVVPPDPSFEPELDDKDEAKDKQLREQDDLSHGAILKGTIEAGHGEAFPVDGDLVYIHLSVRSEDGKVLETTRAEEGDSGLPRTYVLGKGRRALRGWELALYDMKKGERSFFKIKPQYSYAAKDSPLPPPKGTSPDDAFVFDIQLVNWYAKDDVRVVGEDSDIYKRTVKDGTTWETPRAPFEVEVDCKARVPSTSGRQGEGTPYFATAPGAPLRWTMGSGQVPPGLEEGLSSVVKGERAIISVPAALAKGGTLLPAPPDGAERVEYEVELLSMLQVRDMTGTGEVTKRRVKDGVGEFPIDCPIEDSRVRVHYRGYLTATGETFIDTRGADGNSAPVEFDTGMGSQPEALEMAVKLMTPEEVSLVRSAAAFAYDGRPDRPEGVPDGAEVEWELELVSFDRQSVAQSMTPDQKIALATKLKEQGNAVFKAGRHKYAKAKWAKALQLLDRMFDIETDEQAEEVGKVKVACMVNLALCCQKDEEYGDALKWCSKALQEEPDHAKALYRRATVQALLGEYEAAEADLRQVIAVDASAAEEAERELVRLKQRQRAAATKQRQQFRNFFDR
ncbi:hypothetical protein WJX72_008874 [[Myrmecia] bisecta]|uniref:peptidylprolyl isomerase n=1 Tax=[Myrmecia] bisecta TaxID=41462 RepID=A0AAW1PAJ0_9CHLO